MNAGHLHLIYSNILTFIIIAKKLKKIKIVSSAIIESTMSHTALLLLLAERQKNQFRQSPASLITHTSPKQRQKGLQSNALLF